MLAAVGSTRKEQTQPVAKRRTRTATTKIRSLLRGITDDQLDRLTAYSELMDASLSEAISEAIDDFLSNVALPRMEDALARARRTTHHRDNVVPFVKLAKTKKISASPTTHS